MTIPFFCLLFWEERGQNDHSIFWPSFLGKQGARVTVRSFCLFCERKKGAERPFDFFAFVFGKNKGPLGLFAAFLGKERGQSDHYVFWPSLWGKKGPR